MNFYEYENRTYSAADWTISFFIATKKPYAEISIAEITRKADVSRTSFYRNYENKDSVLAQFLANQYQKFIDDINEHKLKSLTEQLTVYLIFSKRIQVLWKPCLMRDSKAVCLTYKRAI